MWEEGHVIVKGGGGEGQGGNGPYGHVGGVVWVTYEEGSVGHIYHIIKHLIYKDKSSPTAPSLHAGPLQLLEHLSRGHGVRVTRTVVVFVEDPEDVTDSMTA